MKEPVFSDSYSSGFKTVPTPVSKKDSEVIGGAKAGSKIILFVIMLLFVCGIFLLVSTPQISVVIGTLVAIMTAPFIINIWKSLTHT